MLKVLSGIILMVATAMAAGAQTVGEKDIVGTWKVVQVIDLEETPAADPQGVQMILDAFSRATFYFKADHSFTFDFDLKEGAEIMEELKIKNQHWKYSDEIKGYAIEDLKNDDMLMGILAEKKDGKTYFLIYESPYLLEVVKE